jgi:hypothetical protein
VLRVLLVLHGRGYVLGTLHAWLLDHLHHLLRGVLDNRLAILLVTLLRWEIGCLFGSLLIVGGSPI